LMCAYITPQQIDRLKFIHSHVSIPFITIFLDRDRAGTNGTIRAMSFLQDTGFSVKVFDWDQKWDQSSEIPVNIKDPADMPCEMIQQLRQQRRI